MRLSLLPEVSRAERVTEGSSTPPPDLAGEHGGRSFALQNFRPKQGAGDKAESVLRTSDVGRKTRRERGNDFAGAKAGRRVDCVRHAETGNQHSLGLRARRQHVQRPEPVQRLQRSVESGSTLAYPWCMQYSRNIAPVTPEMARPSQRTPSVFIQSVVGSQSVSNRKTTLS